MSIRKIKRRSMILQRASTAIKHLLRQAESLTGRYDSQTGAVVFDVDFKSKLMKL